MIRLVPLLLLAACASDHWYLEPEKRDQHVHWSYEGDTGPEHWGDLSKEFETAKTGREQSPIDIRPADTVEAGLPGITFHYRDEVSVFVNNGHTLQHDEGPGNWMELDGQRFDLKQFHSHTPSEHTIDGRHTAGEMHFVHKGPRGRVVVLATLIVPGRNLPDFRELVDSIPKNKGETGVVGPPVNPLEFIPEDRSYWRYEGSFTTPPCTEDVTWIVFKNPVQADAAILERAREILGRCNRPTQPLHDRRVLSK